MQRETWYRVQPDKTDKGEALRMVFYQLCEGVCCPTSIDEYLRAARQISVRPSEQQSTRGRRPLLPFTHLSSWQVSLLPLGWFELRDNRRGRKHQTKTWPRVDVWLACYIHGECISAEGYRLIEGITSWYFNSGQTIRIRAYWTHQLVNISSKCSDHQYIRSYDNPTFVSFSDIQLLIAANYILIWYNPGIRNNGSLQVQPPKRNYRKLKTRRQTHWEIWTPEVMMPGKEDCVCVKIFNKIR